MVADLVLSLSERGYPDVRPRHGAVLSHVDRRSGTMLSELARRHDISRELLRICFEDLGLRRVFAQCFADNVPSWRLMERVGMRREEHAVRESLHRSGEWLDGLRYALLAEEWRDARARTGT